MYNKKQKISTVFENFGKGNPRINTKSEQKFYIFLKNILTKKRKKDTINQTRV